MTRRLIDILLMCMLMCTVACEDEPQGSGLPADALYDYVTLDDTGPDGCSLTMQRWEDSPLITYRAGYDFDKTELIHVGDRMIICYKRTDGSIYTSGPIELYGYVPMANTERSVLTGRADEYDKWRSGQLKPVAMWRTGTYINLEAQIYVYRAAHPASYIMVAEQKTIDDPIPQLRIMYTNAEDNDGLNPYTVYASFDISSIWSRPTCRAVDIKWHGPNGVDVCRFAKPKE